MYWVHHLLLPLASPSSEHGHNIQVTFELNVENASAVPVLESELRQATSDGALQVRNPAQYPHRNCVRPRGSDPWTGLRGCCQETFHDPPSDGCWIQFNVETTSPYANSHWVAQDRTNYNHDLKWLIPRIIYLIPNVLDHLFD